MGIPLELSFEPAEFQYRLERVRGQMAARRMDLLLLFTPSNIYYLSGMHNDNYWDLQCLMVPLGGEPLLVMLAYESGRARNSSWIDDLVLYGTDEDPIEALLGTARGRFPSAQSIGIEQRLDGISPADFGRLATGLDDRRIVDPLGVVEIPRRRKSDAELAYMREAAAQTDRALAAACEAIAEGVRDTDLAAAIAAELYGGGSEMTCYGPIVAIGFRSGAPHSNFSGAAVRRDEPIFLELTGMSHRYTSPCMTTAMIGQPTREMTAISEAGSEALRHILEIAKPGSRAGDVASETIKVLEPVLPGRLFHYLPGYSVGIGFPPSWVESLGCDLRVGNDLVLEPGMTYHVVMSIREFGEFGINQSHTMVVTSSGAESLTKTPSGLRIL